VVLHRGGPPIPNVVRLVPPPPEPPEVRPHFDDVDDVLRVLWFLLDDAIPFDRMWRVSEARALQFLAWLYATGRLTD
jgi:hypothetical protein